MSQQCQVQQHGEAFYHCSTCPASPQTLYHGQFSAGASLLMMKNAGCGSGLCCKLSLLPEIVLVPGSAFPHSLIPGILGTRTYRYILTVVNKQTESHKGFIFYSHEVELIYNDVNHSQPALLTLSCYLSGFSGVLLRSPEIDSPYPSLNTALLASQPYTRRFCISRLALVLIKHSVPISSLRAVVPKDPYSAT